MTGGKTGQCPEPGMPKRIVAIPATTIFTAEGGEECQNSNRFQGNKIRTLTIKTVRNTTFDGCPVDNCPQACTKTFQNKESEKVEGVYKFGFPPHFSAKYYHTSFVNKTGTTTIERGNETHLILHL